MESNHSRPPSVDSVNLGSTYSGYFPSVNHQQHQHQGHLPQPQPNIPLASQYPYQVPYSAVASNSVPSHLQQQQQSYYQQQQHQQQFYASGANNSAPELNYQYSLQVQAAAAAAASAMYQQQQHIQQQAHASPNQPARHQFQPIDPQQNTVNYMSPTSQWPAAVQFQQQQMLQQQYPQQPQQAAAQQHSEYVANYYQEYYREYYKRAIQHQQAQKQAHVRTKTPLKYGSRLHARAAFSAFDNRLLVVEPRAQIALYNLQEIFTEQIYPHLFLQSLLLHVNDEKTGSENIKTPLPFTESTVALNWIRAKQLNDSSMNYELKLILKVITMLYRQNGAVSGLDLSGKCTH